MNNSEPIDFPNKGIDCEEHFKRCYENRYTWESDFKGYKGKCVLLTDDIRENGEFTIDSNFKVEINGIEDKEAINSISHQLWEVCIHRVKRPFEEVHGANTFTAGIIKDIGLEVIVGGKNKGDKYCIKDDIITMVYRHIHNKIVNILTEDIFQTTNGYLSTSYSSVYLNPDDNLIASPLSRFKDTFLQLHECGPWVLGNRSIVSEPFNGNPSKNYEYIFTDLKII